MLASGKGENDYAPSPDLGEIPDKPASIYASDRQAHRAVLAHVQAMEQSSSQRAEARAISVAM